MRQRRAILFVKKAVTLLNIIEKQLIDIRPYSKNPRKNDGAVEYVANSIKEFGFKVPIVIDAYGVIVCGHTRYKAAQRLGLDVVPCVVADDLTPEQVKAFRLADNKTAEKAEWDFDLLGGELDALFDFDMSEFGFDMDEQPEEDQEITEDEYEPELPEEPKAKLGDIYQLGRHRLMCGDSTDRATVKRLLDGSKADMVFTDPPYGVGYTGGLQFKNGKAEKNNREMIKNDDVDIYENVFRILAEFCNGACYVWFADTKAATLYNAAEKYGEIHAMIIWVKNGGYGALNANYKQKHEPCLYWKPKNAKLNFCGATTETTIWEIKKDGVNEYHPTQKPVALPAKAISNHDANIILDLFGGSGSTLIACEQLKRTCYMMELDPKYVDIIINRWEKFTGGKAVLLNGNDEADQAAV